MPNPGEILKEERIKKGLSLREVSDKIKISPNFLDAIENNNLHYLPGGFFTRNFVRAYARVLGLNDEKILKEFNLVNEPFKIEKIEKEKHKRTGFLPLIIIAFSSVFLILIFLLKEKTNPQNEYSSAHPTTPISLTQPKLTTEKNSLTVPEKIEITIKAIEDVWIDADLDGEKVLYKLIRKGEEIKFKGEEFKFNVIGRPEGILVFINGSESIPMGEPGKVAKNIKIDKKNFWRFIKK